MEQVSRENPVDFLIAETSPRLLAIRRERDLPRSAIETRLLDVQRDPAEQGFAVHGCDLLILGNGTATDGGLSNLLHRCRRLLAPGGMLLLQGESGFRAFRTLTGGMLGSAPPAAAKDLVRALTAAGFQDPEIVRTVSRDLVLSLAPSESHPNRGWWLVAAPGSGRELEVAHSLARELQARNQTAVVATESPAPDGGVATAAGIEPFRRDSWSRLLKELPQDEVFRGGGPFAGALGSTPWNGCA